MFRSLQSTFILFLFLGIWRIEGYAQAEQSTDTIQISGVIWDAESFQPLPYAHIYTPTQGTYTNLTGSYQARVPVNDTLWVSYLGYESQYDIVTETSEHHFFWLKPLITNLEEVVVRPLPTESEMKLDILQTETNVSPEVLKAVRNLRSINNLYLYGYRTEMNSLDNYRMFIKGPQPVNFLSTNPYKGVMGVWKNIKRK